MRVSNSPIGLREPSHRQSSSYTPKYSDYIELSHEALHLYNKYLNENPNPLAKLTQTDIIQMVSNGSNARNPYTKYLISY